MRHSPFQSLFALLVVTGLLAGHPATAQEHPRFYEGKAQGWFWYEPEPLEPVEPPVEPAPVIANLPAQVQPAAPAPAPFSAEWVRMNLPKYKDLAWNEPTLENVRAYMYMQRFAVDRSEQFSRMTALAVQGDPYLDEINRRPFANFATQQVERQSGIATRAALRELADKSGLFFFFKAGELYSEAQAPIIKEFERRTGFAVLAVSVDGEPLTDNLFPDFMPDEGHTERLNVLSYPALFLVSEDGHFEPVGQGMMAVSEMENRILVAALRAGLITEQVFETTRAVIPVEADLARLLTRGQEAGSLFSSNTPDNFIEPKELMRRINLALENKGN